MVALGMADLELGIYVNVFPVRLSVDHVEVTTAPRNQFADLQLLRERMKNDLIGAYVYPDEGTLYGYGSDKDKLETYGFRCVSLRLTDAPRMATHVITQGFLENLKTERYEILPRKGRHRVYRPEDFTEVANGQIRVYQGYDLRSVFWRDVATKELTFGLIVDVFWLLRDLQGYALGMKQVSRQYGYEATIAIAQIQREYLPGSSKLNVEAARQRFREDILPFVKDHPTFALPCGGQAHLSLTPVRIVLGNEE